MPGRCALNWLGEGCCHTCFSWLGSDYDICVVFYSFLGVRWNNVVRLMLSLSFNRWESWARERSVVLATSTWLLGNRAWLQTPAARGAPASRSRAAEWGYSSVDAHGSCPSTATSLCGTRDPHDTWEVLPIWLFLYNYLKNVFILSE